MSVTFPSVGMSRHSPGQGFAAGSNAQSETLPEEKD